MKNNILNTKHEQVGRSLVEMLGTLAIMGVLSIGGIAGFNMAVKKHQANDLLNELNLRANQVAIQLVNNPTGTPSIAEFGKGFSGCNDCEFSVNKITGEERFAIKVMGVPVEICKQIYSQIGENSIIRKMVGLGGNLTSSEGCVNATTVLGFIFNNDLSTTEIKCNDRGIFINGVCSCYKGFTGSDCSDGIAEMSCGSNNTGSRYESEGDIGCLCKKGYSGPLCETNTEACNGHGYFFGDENISYSWHRCICEDGYSGDNCETH